MIVLHQRYQQSVKFILFCFCLLFAAISSIRCSANWSFVVCSVPKYKRKHECLVCQYVRNVVATMKFGIWFSSWGTSFNGILSQWNRGLRTALLKTFSSSSEVRSILPSRERLSGIWVPNEWDVIVVFFWKTYDVRTEERFYPSEELWTIKGLSGNDRFLVRFSDSECYFIFLYGVFQAPK